MSFTLNMKSRAYHRIVELSLEFTDPTVAKWCMKDFLDKNIIHTKAIQVKNMLERFRKLDITLREVDDLSARMVYKLKFDKEKVQKQIGSDLMLRKYIDP